MIRFAWVALLSLVCLVVSDAFIAPQTGWLTHPAAARQGSRCVPTTHSIVPDHVMFESIKYRVHSATADYMTQTRVLSRKRSSSQGTAALVQYIYICVCVIDLTVSSLAALKLPSLSLAGAKYLHTIHENDNRKSRAAAFARFLLGLSSVMKVLRCYLSSFQLGDGAKGRRKRRERGLSKKSSQ